jgi:hypothetical protein
VFVLSRVFWFSFRLPSLVALALVGFVSVASPVLVAFVSCLVWRVQVAVLVLRLRKTKIQRRARASKFHFISVTNTLAHARYYISSFAHVREYISLLKKQWGGTWDSSGDCYPIQGLGVLDMWVSRVFETIWYDMYI